MKDENNISLNELQAEVDEVVEGSSKGQLGQCARLLATYIALYKHEFGELSQERFANLSTKLADSLEFGEAVYATGLQELLETLSIVESQGADQLGWNESRTLN
ncbi:MAG: hypothetical protein AAF387_18945 [Pseudomonadota bacterium]